MTPFQDKFVETHTQFDQKSGVPTLAFNIFNSEGEKIKEICSHKLPALQGKGIALLDLVSQINPQYQTSNDRIFIAGKQVFEIDIYNQEGNFLKTIKRDDKKQLLTADDKNKVLEAYKRTPLYKPFWEAIKKAIMVPDYFPALKTFLVTNQKVYVQTFKKKNGKTEFIIFDLNGKYLKNTFLPLIYEDIMTPYLYTIHGGKIYQLVENEDEAWELQISEIQ